MTQFRRVFSSVLSLRPKFRRSLRNHGAINPIANAGAPYRESNSQRTKTHLVPECTLQDVQSSTDTLVEGLVEEVEEAEDEAKDLVSKNDLEVEVHSVGSSADEFLEAVEESADEDLYDDDDDEKDEGIPEVFSYDLVRKTYHEKMTHRIYVAVTDNEREIAALRTQDGARFTHIVRVVFDPLSRRDNITPSSWTTDVTHSANGSSELRLTCPALTLHYSDKLTALSEKQLFAARSYITNALPDRNDDWEAQGFEFPFSPEECGDSRVLIVGSNDRSADVMAILVCYLAFLTGARAGYLLARLQKLTPVQSHWRGDILSKDSLDMVSEVSKQQWKY